MKLNCNKSFVLHFIIIQMRAFGNVPSIFNVGYQDCRFQESVKKVYLTLQRHYCNAGFPKLIIPIWTSRRMKIVNVEMKNTNNFEKKTEYTIMLSHLLKSMHFRSILGIHYQLCLLIRKIFNETKIGWLEK